MKTISYLHLSDLHIGSDQQKGLISQTKKILFEDIDFIISKNKSLDVVFFTGDLVQKGMKEEFELLEAFLQELWDVFSVYKLNPILVCVPGNHDLKRIDDNKNPTQKVLCNWEKEDIKDEYFWQQPNDYITFINDRFKNYTDWYNTTKINKPDNIHWGYLPGDFYCTLNINNIALGIIGLNSAFLQLNNGNAEQKLGIYNKQINYLFNEQYLEWQSKQKISVLLTHHSPDWFEPTSINEYNQEIYCQGSFTEHLCGHMHEPSYTATSINGYQAKRIFISPSLFGLEYYEDSSLCQRIHGYTAGIYKIDSDTISKRIWPRISIKTKSGVLKIAQNEEYNLDKETFSFTEEIKGTFNEQYPALGSPNISTTDIQDNIDNLFAKKTHSAQALTRTLYKELNSHMNIRVQERTTAINQLKTHKYCWITTKFGLGEIEFIGTLINNANINSSNCFCINCDSVSTMEDFSQAFNNSFSLHITKFFDIMNDLDNPLLVLNNATDDLIKNIIPLKDFVQTIFDFCPNLKLIIISEQEPATCFFDCIRLFPLDIPAVKQYIEFSQELHSTFTYLEYEKIHRLSSGIPFYIDKVIEQLKFRPLSDLGDMEFGLSSTLEADCLLPKSLVNEIQILRSSEIKEETRKFLLLSVLSLLHNGETFERIRRLNPMKPFYSDDITYLLNNKLIETLQINSIFEEKYNDSELIKIIRVPRNIRDFIVTLLTSEEKVEVYKLACNLYLGNNWRSTIKLINPKDAELDLIIYQNLQIAIRFLLLHEIDSDNEIEATRMARVAISLVEYFSERGAYKDAVSLAEETLLLMKDIEFKEFKITRIFLMKRLGQDLRMSSFHDKSISILKSICDDNENALSNKDRNNIRLSIAYAYETLDQEDEAIRYANMIKKNESDKNSHLSLSAESVIAHFIKDENEKIKRLNTIKSKAEKFQLTTLKANVVLEICKIEKDENKLNQLDKIIRESKNDIYNKVRALVVKADIILNTKPIDNITKNDLLGLDIAYSYTFYQRLLILLNKCHILIWQYWLKQNRYDQLLHLFRYSSFVWRLCGAFETEKYYLDTLYANPDFIRWFKIEISTINSTYYEQRIFSLYGSNLINPASEGA